MFIYCMYSILGRGSFCFTASIWRGMEVISLWHCWCGMEIQVSLTVAFSSSAFFGLSFLIFFLTIPHRFSMGFRSGEFAGQSSIQHHGHLTNLWCFWQCGQVPNADEILNQHLWKAGQQKEAWSAPKFLGKRLQCFQKTQWTNTSRWHCTPNHHRLWKLNTGLQATCAMSFSTLPPDSRTLVSKWNTKLALIWKENFGPLGNSQVLLLLSPGKTPLTTTVTKFIDTSVCGGSWCLDPSLSPFLLKFT